MEQNSDRTHLTGTRAEILAELDDRAEGWHRMASDRKAERARQAAQSVREGANSVRVGRITFNVTEDALPAPRDSGDAIADDPVT